MIPQSIYDTKKIAFFQLQESENGKGRSVPNRQRERPYRRCTGDRQVPVVSASDMPKL